SSAGAVAALSVPRIGEPFGAILPVPVAALAFGIIVALRSCATVLGEKQGDTLESLLLTPWPYGEILASKYYGIVRAFIPYLAAYSTGAVAAALFYGGETVLVTVWFVPLVWLAVVYVGFFGVGETKPQQSFLTSFLNAGIPAFATSVPIVGLWAALFAG